jgi:phosphoribosylaminoimidazole-succinocarboxamide synthase
VSPGPAPLHEGKIRRLYDVGDGLLVMVASDKISAFDVVMAEPIPDKGRVLTAMTAFWCTELSDVPNHLVSADPAEIVSRLAAAGISEDGRDGNAILVRRAEMLPVECIVRGYLAGSAFKEYASRGTVHGTPMPAGLRLADALPEPVFTPSTKFVPTPDQPEGHDENIDFEAAVALVGRRLAIAARDLCLALYREAAERAARSGLVLADTKFELGLVEGELVVCDEIVTPDSSRLWEERDVVPGEAPPAFDKQPLRDWLEAQPWDKRPPPPPLPAGIVEATSRRYVSAYERVTGRSLADWYGART